MSENQKSTLRDEFTKAYATKLEGDLQQRRQNVERVINDWAENLEKKLKKEMGGENDTGSDKFFNRQYVVNQGIPPYIFFFLPEPMSDKEEVLKLPSYKKLHEACQRADIRVDKPSADMVCISYTLPYKGAPDAQILDKEPGPKEIKKKSWLKKKLGL